MPLWIPPAAFGKAQTNVTAAARIGTTITASATPHAKGAYSAGQLIASTDEDTYAITVHVKEVSAVATVTSYLLDIGFGVSGSEVTVVEDLDCWGSGTAGASRAGTKCWHLPLFIPKGARVAARAQALAVSDTASVAIFLHQAADGWGMEVPRMWERLGAVDAASNGVSVTPGNGAYGNWTTILDPITKNYRWWHCSMGGLADTTLQAVDYAMEIGFGDTTAAVTTIGTWLFMSDTSEGIAGPSPYVPVFMPLVDDDAKGIFARLATSEVEARSVLVYAAE